MDFIYSIVQQTLDALGGSIPNGDLPTFVTTFFLAGWMVSADAAIFMIAVLPLVAKRLWLPIAFVITLTHAVAGYLGLGLLMLGLSAGATLWMLLAATTYGGLHFIAGGLSGDDEDDPNDMAQNLVIGILTMAAIVMFWNVSFDEFFAVLQRYQWMVAQGWDHTAMAISIGFSMVVLFGILCLVTLMLVVAKPVTDWIHDQGDKTMFVVFSLIMYYLVRGIVQNGLGYTPWEIPYTGIAPELLIAGFGLTWGFKHLLETEGAGNLVKKMLRV
jgi:hypothetical protein